MPHGQRDWSNIGADETVHGIADMAELAARLWSPAMFNREGNVLYMETWDHGFQEWENGAYGTGADIRISAIKSRLGPYSCRMVPGTDSVHFAYVQHVFPYPVLSRFGLEFSFQVTGYLEKFDVLLDVYDGENLTMYVVRYDDTTDELKIYNQSGSYVVVATGVTVSRDGTLFHTIKMVTSLDTGYYARLILDETEHDLTAYQARVSASGTDPNLTVSITFYTQTGKSTTVYVDDIIITQNEP